jgi:hypothetical protein
MPAVALGRERLEREISTLLQAIDTLETEPADPGRSRERWAKLAQVESRLSTTVHTLRAL